MLLPISGRREKKDTEFPLQWKLEMEDKKEQQLYYNHLQALKYANLMEHPPHVSKYIRQKYTLHMKNASI